jgi:hypothetical protein
MRLLSMTSGILTVSGRFITQHDTSGRAWRAILMSRRYHLPWSRALRILSPVPVHPSDNDAGGSGHLRARANRQLSRQLSRRALLRSAASLGIAAAVVGIRRVRGSAEGVNRHDAALPRPICT